MYIFFCTIFSRERQRGVTMLLVAVIVSALLSISVGIFNVIYGQIRISGDINDSFLSFYAADQGMEKTFYRDRVLQEICAVPGCNCFTDLNVAVTSGACYTAVVSRNCGGGSTDVVSTGQYQCTASPNRVIKRGFQASY